MRAAVFVNTPAQVHFYKNIIASLERNGNDVFVLARNYGTTVELLNELGLLFFVYSRPPQSKLGKIALLPKDVVTAFRFLKDKRIDVISGFGAYSTSTARLLGATDITFQDSEGTISAAWWAIIKYTQLLTDVFVTPSSFTQELGAKHLRVESYKELAYLHPRYYRPDESVLDLLGVAKLKNYAVLRFNAFDATHDLGVTGMSNADKVILVKELEQYGDVFVSSESGVPEQIRDHVLRVPNERIHDVLYYATLLITDTQTMATEAALLGTPTIRSNAFVGKKDMGNFTELEREYGLLFNVRTTSEVKAKAIELLQDSQVKEKWQARRARMLKTKVDLTALMCQLIEEYPASFQQFKEQALHRLARCNT